MDQTDWAAPSTARAGGLPYFTGSKTNPGSTGSPGIGAWVLNAFRLLAGPIDMGAPGGGIEKPSQGAAGFDVLDHFSF
jgi:hypothetical protein